MEKNTDAFSIEMGGQQVPIVSIGNGQLDNNQRVAIGHEIAPLLAAALLLGALSPRSQDDRPRSIMEHRSLT